MLPRPPRLHLASMSQSIWQGLAPAIPKTCIKYGIHVYYIVYSIKYLDKSTYLIVSYVNTYMHI